MLPFTEVEKIGGGPKKKLGGVCVYRNLRFKITNLGQLWDILIKLIGSVEEFG